jgi:hypothetical protein
MASTYYTVSTVVEEIPPPRPLDLILEVHGGILFYNHSRRR